MTLSMPSIEEAKRAYPDGFLAATILRVVAFFVKVFGALIACVGLSRRSPCFEETPKRRSSWPADVSFSLPCCM